MSDDEGLQKMPFTIDWELLRLDQGEPARRPVECLLEVKGVVRVAGKRAGWVNGFYVHTDDLSSHEAFWTLWDLDERALMVFERIVDGKWRRLREPLPSLMLTAPGLICIEELVLMAGYRKRGLGIEVMERLVRECADLRIGALLLQSEPWQYDYHEEDDDVWDHVVADLPVDDQERDRVKLQNHFRAWGMQRLPRTTYMVAEPETLCAERASSWPPCTIQDLSNTCVYCDRLIDFKTEEWERTSEGLAHKQCG